MKRICVHCGLRFSTKRNVYECGNCALLKATGREWPKVTQGRGGERVPRVSGTYPQKQGAELPGLLNAANLKTGPTSLTIASADEKTIKGEKKLVLGFSERKEQLVCNITNARNLASKYGDETADWIGKTVQFVVVQVPYQNKLVPGIRIAD